MHPEDFTFYQINALAALPGEGEVKGEDLREFLRKNGSKKNPAGFSRAMQKLEDCGLVTSHHTTFRVNDRTIREKRFEITPEGSRLSAEARTLIEDPSLNPKFL